MNQPNHCAFGPLLSPYHDGELPPDRQAEVASHAAICLACRAELADIRQFSAVMTSSDRPAVPAGLNERLVQAMESDIAPTPLRLPTSPRTMRYVRWFSGVAAAVCVLALGRIGYQHFSHSPVGSELPPGQRTVDPQPGPAHKSPTTVPGKALEPGEQSFTPAAEPKLSA